jgi:hypothetical protein
LKKKPLLPEYDSGDETKIDVGEDNATSGKLIIDVEEEGDEYSPSAYVLLQLSQMVIGFEFPSLTSTKLGITCRFPGDCQ